MDKIEIVQMTKTEFDNYINSCWSNYIKEHTISGLSISEAKAQVEKAEKELIPNGFKTKDNFFWTIKKDNKNIGSIWLWLNSKSKALYLSDIFIQEEYRNQGIGKFAMNFIEKKAVELKVLKIKLHVFGHNQTAHNLYQQVGFKATNIVREKSLQLQ